MSRVTPCRPKCTPTLEKPAQTQVEMRIVKNGCAGEMRTLVCSMLELVLRLAPGLCLLVRYFDANFDHPKATKDATRIATVQQVLRRAWLIAVVNVDIWTNRL